MATSDGGKLCRNVAVVCFPAPRLHQGRNLLTSSFNLYEQWQVETIKFNYRPTRFQTYVPVGLIIKYPTTVHRPGVLHLRGNQPTLSKNRLRDVVSCTKSSYTHSSFTISCVICTGYRGTDDCSLSTSRTCVGGTSSRLQFPWWSEHRIHCRVHQGMQQLAEYDNVTCVICALYFRMQIVPWKCWDSIIFWCSYSAL